MGRPSDYEVKVKPHLAEVKKWVENGATNAEIAKALDITVSTLCRYKTIFPDFSDAFARGRVEVICDIKAALLKKALGFTYEEKRQCIQKDKDGNDKLTTEIMTRYCVPSETAAAMLLRNYDEAYNDNDNATLVLKRQELELRKKIAESRDLVESH